MARSFRWAAGVLGAASLAAGVATPRAGAAVLFTTQGDWGTTNGWAGANGSTIATSALFDADASAINGAGNTTAAGGVGVPGSLQVTFGGNGYGEVAGISGENANAGFISAFDPGATASTAATYSGTVNLYYTVPNSVPTNGYFQIGIFLQYAGDGYYGPFLSSSQVATSAGVNATGETEMMATIPYSVVGGAFNGFGFGVFVNTNAAAGGTFYVDALATPSAAVPEPASVGLLGLGGGALAARRRRRR